ncbi:MAG: hypothetical protein RL462_1572 [Pseudomonadota bacterium]
MLMQHADININDTQRKGAFAFNDFIENFSSNFFNERRLIRIVNIQRNESHANDREMIFDSPKTIDGNPCD